MLVLWRCTVAGLILIALVGVAGQAVACVVSRGDPILLASQGLDPDVFVWDSAAHLIAYEQGNYDTESVLRHTLLANPGTSAIVIDCRASAVRPQYGKSDVDLVGVKLNKGPNRGRYGWVVADDVRRPDGKPVIPPSPASP
jgi:hypothetical protein